MNLYILNDILGDYTAGMAVIAADSLDSARAIFVEHFPLQGAADFDTAEVQVIAAVNHPAGLVSHVFGGG